MGPKQQGSFIFKSFLSPPENTPPGALLALSRFFRARQPSTSFQSAPLALIELDLREDGSMQTLHVLSLAAALLWLFQELCSHARENDQALPALSAFTGQPLSVLSSYDPAKQAQACMDLVIQEMERWRQISTLQERHRMFGSLLRTETPDVVTLVEYDQQWRILGVPDEYDVVWGAGQASVAFRRQRFRRLGGDRGGRLTVGSHCYDLPCVLCAEKPKIRSEEEQEEQDGPSAGRSASSRRFVHPPLHSFHPCYPPHTPRQHSCRQY